MAATQQVATRNRTGKTVNKKRAANGSAVSVLKQILGIRELETGIYAIRPSQAKELVKLNTRNRKVSKRRVLEMKREMEAGLWAYNGETVKFATSGQMLDGQHRMLALSECTKPQRMLLVFGLDDSAVHTVDIGRKRSAGDMFVMQGEVNGKALAATLNLLSQFREKRDLIGRKNTVPFPELEATLKTDPRVRHSIQFVSNKCPELRDMAGYPSTAMFCHYVFRRQHQGLGDELYYKLESGSEMKKGDPALVFRNFLMRNSRQPTYARINQDQMTALWFETWLAYRAGEKLDKLAYRDLTYLERNGLPDIGHVRYSS